jgi:hypothetical protein
MMDGPISLEKMFYFLMIEHSHQISDLTRAAAAFFWLRALYVVLHQENLKKKLKLA